MTIRVAKNPRFASVRFLKKQKKSGYAPVSGTFLDWLNKKARLPNRPAPRHWARLVVRKVIKATRRDRRSPAAVRATADSGGSGGDPDPEPPRPHSYTYSLPASVGGAL
jgi:hypothetical protein